MFTRRCLITGFAFLAALSLTFGLVPPTGIAQDNPIAKRPAWTTSRVHGSPTEPAPYRLAPAFPRIRFELPTSIEEVPGTGRLLVTERAGKIFTFPKSAEVSQADLAADLRERLPSDLASQNVSLFDAE